jgi:hypothetical protein
MVVGHDWPWLSFRLVDLVVCGIAVWVLDISVRNAGRESGKQLFKHSIADPRIGEFEPAQHSKNVRNVNMTFMHQTRLRLA